ncbi:MAG: ABC transporter substrate-binding protein, partial [Pseudomonadota bacterium]
MDKKTRDPILRQLPDRVSTGGSDFRLTTSRRAVMVGAMAAAAGAGLAPYGFMGQARAQTPKRGGRLRIGVAGSSTTDTLNPTAITSSMVGVLIGQIRNGLIELDADGGLVGELAETWEPGSSGADEWILRLRQGVTFHSGKTFDAQDVLYSLNLHIGEESQSPLKSVFGAVTELQAEDSHTVRIRLDAGNADFPVMLSDPRLQIVQDGDTDFDSGNGTGGYRLDSWQPGVRAFATRNPDYWKADHANFDEVETIAIEDATARTTALMRGDIDVMNRVERANAGRLASVDGVEIIVQNGYKHYTLPMRADTAPFDDNNVRLAVKYAVDRQEILTKVLFGYGVLGNDHPISTANRYHATPEELPQRELDPDKARFHLKQAGLDSLEIVLNTSEVAFEGAVDAAQLYQSSARAAGINITVKRNPSDGYWSNIWRNESWVMSYWSGRPTEDWQFTE